MPFSFLSEDVRSEVLSEAYSEYLVEKDKITIETKYKDVWFLKFFKKKHLEAEFEDYCSDKENFENGIRFFYRYIFRKEH